MNSYATDRLARLRSVPIAAAAAAAAVLWAAPLAMADDEEALEPRAEATVGVRFYDIDDRDNDFLAGFWDQYRHTRQKNDDPPFFLDVLHLDAGLARPDDTYLMRLESFSPNATNDRVELDGLFRGLRLDLDYRRYRSEELRLFPTGTFQGNAPIGAPYGAQFNSDASLSQIRNSNRRFWLRRTALGGELRLRPDGFGNAIPVLAQATVRSSFEQRKGYRHDRFMLDATDEFSTPTSRFRGFRRQTDQEVTNVGGNVVLQLVDLEQANWTQEFDVSFEKFRERANTVTLADIAARDPGNIPLFGNNALRGFDFTPNTDRISASSRANLELGPVGIDASGFVSHLRQTNKAPLQRLLGISRQDVLTWSAHLGVDVPLGDSAELTAFAKVNERRNELSESDFQPRPAISAILRRRTEIDAEVELAARPAAGSLVATGYRYEWVDRNLRRAPTAKSASLSLVEEGSRRHAVYVRGRAHLMRRMHVAGELGWEYAPERDYPTDLTYAVYFDGRVSYTLPRPWPITLSMNGSVRDGKGNGRVLDAPGTEATKDLDRRQWDYTASVAMVPTTGANLSLSFTHQRDRQDFPFVRFDVPGVVTFLPDPERVHYRSDVKSLALNAAMKLTDSIEIRHSESINWVSAFFGNQDISRVLEDVNEIDQTVVSLGWGVGWQALPGLELDFGYRLDQFGDDAVGGLPTGDDVRHMYTLGATVGLDLFTSAVSD